MVEARHVFLWSSVLIAVCSLCSPPDLDALSGTENEVEEAYARAEYRDCMKRFLPLALTPDKDYALHNCLLASCALASGEYPLAKDALVKATSVMTGFVPMRAETALASPFVAEDVKVYKGDPYEKMMGLVYLGLIFYNEGDFENALACFKSAALFDASSEEHYVSDCALVHLGETKAYLKLGDLENAQKTFDQAREAWLNTHVRIRKTISERIGLEKASQAFRQVIASGNVGRKDVEELTEQVVASEGRIRSLREKESQLRESLTQEPFFSMEHIAKANLLILIDYGLGPVKIPTGWHGSLVSFQQRFLPGGVVEIILDGQNVGKSLPLADLYFQASTRGGREIEALLQGRAIFKDASLVSGKVLSVGGQLAANLGTAVPGLGLAGLAVQGLGLAAKPQGDVRCWYLLPNEAHVFLAELSTGTHKVTLKLYDEAGIATGDSLEKEVTLENDRDAFLYVRTAPSG